MALKYALGPDSMLPTPTHLHTPILSSLSCLCSHVSLDIKSAWLYNKEGGVSRRLHEITFAGLCCLCVCVCMLPRNCVCVCVWGREREVGVETAAAAWGEVLPWFSLEFLCFWKPERGKLNLRSPRVSAPWELSVHISLPLALMVLGVALFSKLRTAQVFFTFQEG